MCQKQTLSSVRNMIQQVESTVVIQINQPLINEKNGNLNVKKSHKPPLKGNLQDTVQYPKHVKHK
jgi:hypothetical protein